jgi:hypothetical protein
VSSFLVLRRLSKALSNRLLLLGCCCSVSFWLSFSNATRTEADLLGSDGYRIGVIDLLLLGVVGRLIDADFLVATDPDLSSGNRCGETDLLSDYITRKHV